MQYSSLVDEPCGLLFEGVSGSLPLTMELTWDGSKGKQSCPTAVAMMGSWENDLHDLTTNLV